MMFSTLTTRLTILLFFMLFWEVNYYYFIKSFQKQPFRCRMEIKNRLQLNSLLQTLQMYKTALSIKLIRKNRFLHV